VGDGEIATSKAREITWLRSSYRYYSCIFQLCCSSDFLIIPNWTQ